MTYIKNGQHKPMSSAKALKNALNEDLVLISLRRLCRFKLRLMEFLICASAFLTKLSVRSNFDNFSLFDHNTIGFFDGGQSMCNDN